MDITGLVAGDGDQSIGHGLLSVFVQCPRFLDHDALLNASPLGFGGYLICDMRHDLGMNLTRAGAWQPAALSLGFAVDETMHFPRGVCPAL